MCVSRSSNLLIYSTLRTRQNLKIQLFRDTTQNLEVQIKGIHLGIRRERIEPEDFKFLWWKEGRDWTILSQIHEKILQYKLLWDFGCLKQFVVTNCSKEWPGSIVTETLKSGILISIVTSKELHFNADFKYISFIKISFTHQKLRAWEYLPHFRK